MTTWGTPQTVSGTGQQPCIYCWDCFIYYDDAYHTGCPNTHSTTDVASGISRLNQYHFELQTNIQGSHHDQGKTRMAQELDDRILCQARKAHRVILLRPVLQLGFLVLNPPPPIIGYLPKSSCLDPGFIVFLFQNPQTLRPYTELEIWSWMILYDIPFSWSFTQTPFVLLLITPAAYYLLTIIKFQTFKTLATNHDK